MGLKRVAIFIGNKIYGDDCIGLVVGDLLRAKLEERGFDVHVIERTGFALLDYLEGYDHAVVVDSICTDCATGSVLSLSAEDFSLAKPNAPHFSGVPEAVGLMRDLRLAPPRVSIIGINVKDPYTLSEEMSYDLDRMKGEISKEVFHDILTLSGQKA